MTTSPLSLPPTGRSLPIALIRARENVMSPIRAMLQKSGITEQQWRILRVLSENGPMDNSRLGDRACLLAPSVTRILQSMRERGLVTHEPDAKDRRRLIASITPEGQQIIDANLPEAVKLASDVRNRLGQERFDLLLDLLEELDPGA